MTPEEKAKELIKKFKFTQRGFIMPDVITKQCALIAVDEIIKESSDAVTTLGRGRMPLTDKEYWLKVKESINQLKQ